MTGRRLWVGLLAAVIGSACAPRRWQAGVNEGLSAEEYVRRAEVFRQNGMELEAQRALESAVAADESHVPARLAAGEAAAARGEFNMAARHFEAARKIRPEDSGIQVALAEAYAGAGRRLGKAEELALAARSDPAFRAAALAALARIYLRQGRRAEAEAAVRDARGAATPENAALRNKIDGIERALRARGR